MVGEITSTTAQLRIEGLPNGTYFARVRGVDNLGLEGRDSVGELLVNVASAPVPNPPAETPAAPRADTPPAEPAPR
jgi:hypothetical protein